MHKVTLLALIMLTGCSIGAPVAYIPPSPTPTAVATPKPAPTDTPEPQAPVVVEFKAAKAEIAQMPYDTEDNLWGTLVVRPRPGVKVGKVNSVSVYPLALCHPHKTFTVKGGGEGPNPSVINVTYPVDQELTEAGIEVPVRLGTPKESDCTDGGEGFSLAQITVTVDGKWYNVSRDMHTAFVNYFKAGNVGVMTIKDSVLLPLPQTLETGLKNKMIYRWDLTASIDEDIELVAMKATGFIGLKAFELHDMQGSVLYGPLDQPTSTLSGMTIPKGSSRSITLHVETTDKYVRAGVVEVEILYRTKTSQVLRVARLSQQQPLP